MGACCNLSKTKVDTMTQFCIGNGKIAIIYCAADQVPSGREQERIADGEVEEAAAAVKAALEAYGQAADVLRVHPGRLEALLDYAWIFNLAENVSGLDDLEYNITRGMEEMGLHFTGSGAAALKTCLDKASAKARLIQHGLLTPAYTVIYPGEAVETDLPFPLFVKPVQVDGSVGISADSQVHTPAELEARVREIHRLYQQAALVEEYIEGRDISAAIIGNGAEIQALPLSEVVYRPAFAGPRVLTYEAIWLDGSAAYANNDAVCPCQLSSQTRDLIMDMARSSYNALGCEDYARVDFRLHGDTPYVLEVNPNPCIHPDGSGFARSCQAAGLDFPAMIQMILEQSLRKHALYRAAQQEKETLLLVR